jgi:F420-dependent methylenetetrahydromethanopterin dehydrogenase
VRKEDFLEWRSQTIAVLRASNPKSPLPRKLVENLLNTLGPVLRIDDSSVQKAVNKLCEKALEAILLLRMSKTTMTWDFPRDNEMFNPDEMEPLNGDIRSGDSTNATVLYTVFGSVIKLLNPLYLIDDEPPRVVLRKAEVLLHDPPR